MTSRIRADVAATPLRRRARPTPVLETVDGLELVARGDKVIRLPDRLTLIETEQRRQRYALLALVGVTFLTGGPQALAALKTLGLF